MAKGNLKLLHFYYAITGFFQSLFNLIGLEMRFYNPSSSETALMKYLSQKYNIGIILDVGASKGQYGQKVFKNGFKGKIYSFEPISNSFDYLQKNAESNPNWTAFNFGLGDKTDSFSINVSYNSDSSSILGMNDTHVKNAEIASYVGTEEVKIRTLDSFFEENKLDNTCMMLKLDVQGYEKNVLIGAVNNLSKISIIQAELSLTTLYDGGVLIEEIISILRKEGFELYTLIQGFKNKKSGQTLQVDGIFIRKSLL